MIPDVWDHGFFSFIFIKSMSKRLPLKGEHCKQVGVQKSVPVCAALLFCPFPRGLVIVLVLLFL
ncbi:MAG: hypothetical protein CSA33_00200 [Desulfobulbus propionicus]|nr:MAG: hypothetical protein CSA33_00200 [Desulfobulbus propionicus]